MRQPVLFLLTATALFSFQGCGGGSGGSDNEVPVFTNPPTSPFMVGDHEEHILEVMTLEATDPDGDALSFGIAGGDNASFFVVDGAVLSFKTKPDWAAPADSDSNNVYEVIVFASDGEDATTAHALVSVIDSKPSVGN